jgi:hypothetical protein
MENAMTRKIPGLVTSAGLITLLYGVTPASAQTAPSLGSAETFAVLGGSTVTNTGSSIVAGDLGVSPGTAITGFPPGLVGSGTIHAADAAALTAQNSLTAAYDNLANRVCTRDLTGQDLGGQTLTAGVYCFSSSAQLTGMLTLAAEGNAGAVFIFKIGSTLTTASGSRVSLIDGASPSNVFWQVGSSATLGTTTSFAGNILALTSITVTTGASVAGRILARNGAVTLDTNAVIALASGARAIQASVVNLFGVTTTLLAATGALGGSNDARQASEPTGAVPSLVTADTLHATTIGWPDQVESEASLANLAVTVGATTIGAEYVMARASAVHGRTGEGNVSIEGLSIDGLLIAITGNPNQTIVIPGGRVVINEQSTSSTGILVNALHIAVTGVADVVVAAVRAGVE